MGENEPKDATLIAEEFMLLLADIRASKPNERSELARRYAIVLTELEKAYSYFQVYVNESVWLQDNQE